MMDTSTLQIAADELASYLSEVTVGDLGSPVGEDGTDIGDLLTTAFGEMRDLACQIGTTPFPAGSEKRAGHRPALRVTRDVLPGLADLYGAGYENLYRREIKQLCAALSAHARAHPDDARLDVPVGDLVDRVRAHTSAIAAALRID